ncbi:MAG TPA: DNA polymerase III subunit gamma/tau [Syntrophomonadaceae bacterium]|nr:DNA polymerase III subunit gamma/tau [Syntrophomonadaceae bacterium]
MEQLALYREWRPQFFRDVVGQDHVCRTLRNAIVLGRLAHAYLFCGPRGTGKTSTARILAKAANCPNSRDGEPCNSCESCRSITAGTAFDVLEMDAASHRGIEEIRDLRQKVGFAPTAGRFKFYIIDEVHMLTGEAFNALLKTLEEPPRHTVFVLATTEAHRVPATILSRCQRFDFRRLGRGLIAAHLERVARDKGWEVEPEALNLIARRAGGALRDALGLLDQAASFTGGHVTAAGVEALTGILGEEALKPVLDAVYLGDVPSLLEQLEGFSARGCEPRQLLYQLTDYAREALFAARSAGTGMEWHAAVLRGLAEADAEMRGSSRPDLVLELALLRLADASPFRQGAAAGFQKDDSPGAPSRAERAAAGAEDDRRNRPIAGGSEEGAETGPARGGRRSAGGKSTALLEPPPGCETKAPPEKPQGTLQGDRGEGEHGKTDLVTLRKFLQGRFRKQPLMGQVLAAAEIGQAGGKILISAPPPFGMLLQKEENRRSLQEVLREFDSRLELEIGENASDREGLPEVPVGGTNRREEGVKRRDAAAGPEEGVDDPVVGVALSLFKGKLIKRREDGD